MSKNVMSQFFGLRNRDYGMQVYEKLEYKRAKLISEAELFGIDQKCLIPKDILYYHL